MNFLWCCKISITCHINISSIILKDVILQICIYNTFLDAKRICTAQIYPASNIASISFQCDLANYIVTKLRGPNMRLTRLQLLYELQKMAINPSEENSSRMQDVVVSILT